VCLAPLLPESVYPLIIIQRYGVDRGLPYSVLAFRLEKGEDEKKCLAVKLKGEFIRSGLYQDVNVKVSYGTSLAPCVPIDLNQSFFAARIFDVYQKTPNIS
jgi:hypothetical protein